MVLAAGILYSHTKRHTVSRLVCMCIIGWVHCANGKSLFKHVTAKQTYISACRSRCCKEKHLQVKLLQSINLDSWKYSSLCFFFSKDTKIGRRTDWQMRVGSKEELLLQDSLRENFLTLVCECKLPKSSNLSFLWPAKLISEPSCRKADLTGCMASPQNWQSPLD